MGRSLGTLLGTSAEELEAHVGDQEQVPGLKTIVESQGQVAGLEDELQWPEVVPGEHKVFNWTDAESTSSIWLMQNLSQSETDAKSRSRIMTDTKSRS